MFEPENFIYSLEDLVKYYRSNNITSDNYLKITPNDTRISPFLVELPDKKSIFLPYAGEFGTCIARYLPKFHYTNAKYKIACIPKGYECYFPDAKEFIYDYPGPKWGSSEEDLVKLTPDTRYFKWNTEYGLPVKDEFIKFAKSIDPEIEVRKIASTEVIDPVTKYPIRTFAKIPFKNSNKYGIKVDVIFSNRTRPTIPGKDNRSFQKWAEVVKYLQSKGLTVGGIGKSGFSFEDIGVINNFDYENPNEASIEMLHNARYYIGTDTGVTHLAMNFANLKSLLFRANDGSADWIYCYENRNTRIIHEMCRTIDTFNDEKLLYKHIDQFFI